MITFAHPLFLCCIPLVCVLSFVRWKWYDPMLYFYPALHITKTHTRVFPLLLILRTIILVSLVIALARPRKEMGRLYSRVDGIDIQMLIDVSGSMDLYDDIRDTRSRLTIAKDEALKFIQKRTMDSIGLVIFGSCAVTKCPVTHDKELLSQFIKDLSIGIINPEGTMLSGALLLAAKKLSTVNSKSRIIIMLTDGAPSPHDIDIEEVLPFLQKHEIKVYTIGVGSEAGGYCNHPLYGVVSIPTPVNKELLSYVADKTGGQCFEAQNARELERIYDTINTLETSERDVAQSVMYQDFFSYFLWISAMGLLFELLYAWWLRWL